jgi:hypothetical protein
MLPYAFTIIVLVLGFKRSDSQPDRFACRAWFAVYPRTARTLNNFLNRYENYKKEYRLEAYKPLYNNRKQDADIRQVNMKEFAGYHVRCAEPNTPPDQVTYTCPKDGGNLDVVLEYDENEKNSRWKYHLKG